MAASRRIETITVDQSLDRRPKRICIVTSEFVGLWRNGGIGTAMSGLAELLVKHGHQVTVLYTRGHFLTAAACRAWTRQFARQGISFLPTRPRDFRGAAGPLAELGFLAPAIVAKLLRERQFDVIHLNDAGGHGYLVAAAHHFGVGFSGAHVVTGLHGPTRWTSLLNETPTSPLLQFVEEAEQVAIGCSQIVWSPSRYLVDWLTAREFRLPATVLLQQYVLPSRDPAGPASGFESTGGAGRRRHTTLVFFGRLEARKGLGLFLEFLDRNREQIAAAGLDVVFMGRIGRLLNERADVESRRRAAGWRFAWRIASTLGQAEAVAFLRSPGKLAVIASPEDNSPCTVYEAIEHRIPFVAAATGGIPEIIHPEDGAQMTFAYEAASLQRCLETAIRCGAGRAARPAITREENTARWLSFHAAPERWAATRQHHNGGRVGIIGVVFAAARSSETLATVTGLRELAPDLKALLVVGGSEARLPDGVLGVAPGDLSRALAGIVARHSDAALAFFRGGVTCVPASLMRMIGHLGTGDVDGLIPAAFTAGGKTIEPPPFSARLRDMIDPMSTGLIAFSAAVVAATLEAAEQDPAQTPPQLVEALAAAGTILPYPEVVATLPSRLAPKCIRGNGCGKGANGIAQAGLALVISRDGRAQQIRRLVMAMLASPVGVLVPYGVGIVEGFQNAARRLTEILGSRSRTAWR